MTRLSLKFKSFEIKRTDHFCVVASPAYGATLIEHSLIEVGLPGSVKVDNEVVAAQGTVEQIECGY